MKTKKRRYKHSPTMATRYGKGNASVQLMAQEDKKPWQECWVDQTFGNRLRKTLGISWDTRHLATSGGSGGNEETLFGMLMGRSRTCKLHARCLLAHTGYRGHIQSRQLQERPTHAHTPAPNNNGNDDEDVMPFNMLKTPSYMFVIHLWYYFT